MQDHWPNIQNPCTKHCVARACSLAAMQQPVCGRHLAPLQVIYIQSFARFMTAAPYMSIRHLCIHILLKKKKNVLYKTIIAIITGGVRSVSDDVCAYVQRVPAQPKWKQRLIIFAEESESLECFNCFIYCTLNTNNNMHIMYRYLHRTPTCTLNKNNRHVDVYTARYTIQNNVHDHIRL